MGHPVYSVQGSDRDRDRLKTGATRRKYLLFFWTMYKHISDTITVSRLKETKKNTFEVFP